ncbi:hypothetical protein GGX14DRAFT_185272 [Mycena pura]|uniref:poly(ADP-ribose) glycohydrolase n=1 Tax=Mycena pura TaxID=153505 RepID=A0AAD6UZD2_9AGAR|nr:hypothetical protein GGX14DRAFT_185272 [Mycena pura]
MLVLPSSPLTVCYDRYSLTDVETDDPIPFWSILTRILIPVAQSTSQLIDAIDTIAVSLRGQTDSDMGFLRRFIDEKWDADSFFQRTWPLCVEIALEMSALFPNGQLEPLSSNNPTIECTSRQIACLVIHQFLCTLPKLPWTTAGEEDNSANLWIWYGSEQPHPNAVNAYLTALFVFFERIDYGSVASHSISLALHTAPHAQQPATDTWFTRIHITALDTPVVTAEFLGMPSGACVVSANKDIGFGRTASQEMHVGCTPQALPAKLVTQSLAEGEVMVLRGCAATIELSGYGRGATLGEIIPAGAHDWATRTMLFMDALPLDGYHMAVVTPDLLPGHLERELTKAFTAFASYDNQARYATVVTGHWGCGAFGGNREIKSLIQWCAASMAGVQLNFVCENDSFSSDFRNFADRALQSQWTVHSVFTTLRAMSATDEGRQSAFRKVTQILKSL